MTIPQIPAFEPPSGRRLLRSTLITLLVSAVIVVTIVLPAEYGVDPTGIGRVLGLKEMGEIKMQLLREDAQHAAEAAVEAADQAAPRDSALEPVADSAVRRSKE